MNKKILSIDSFLNNRKRLYESDVQNDYEEPIENSGDKKTREESVELVELSFNIDDVLHSFKGEDSANTYFKVFTWLYDNKYFNFRSSKESGRAHEKKFTTEEKNEYIQSKIDATDLSDKEKTKRRISQYFYNIKGTDDWIIINGGTYQYIKWIWKKLIDIKGFDKYSFNPKVVDKRSGNSIPRCRIFNDKDCYIPELCLSKNPQKDIRIPFELKDRPILKPKPNPFIDAICVLGDSGAGKSVTIRKMLENAEPKHEFHYIIPTSTSTGLLSQYLPNHGYVLSILGEMIEESYNHPSTLYTAVFDECHKSNVIEMINDELLQCITTNRNEKNRFITLDANTLSLYRKDSGETARLGIHRYKLDLPDNFGFIFISSKEEVICNNDDFYNRVDIVKLDPDWKINMEIVKTCQDLIDLKLNQKEKNDLKTHHDTK